MLSFTELSALCLFLFSNSITLGPNNALLSASCFHYGFKKSLPFLAGLCCGFFFLALLVGSGFNAVFQHFPQCYKIMQILCVLYLLYLAWKIATSKGRETPTRQKAFGFFQSFALQFINPKLWLAATGMASTYLPTGYAFADLLKATLIGILILLPCSLLWMLCGSILHQWMKRPLLLRLFNLTMAALLLLSLYPLTASLIP
ncbi:LysE family translocator [Zymomonas sp.]|uniref:LysE family translocator n=1 Tax=Zymomonas sp. TaxID=2068624 RepID=UPI0025CFDD4D|nr:LysE family translocator [Zymomonas sp.]MCA1956178.1 LysE family translocator [Zymomonas sp.]